MVRRTSWIVLGAFAVVVLAYGGWRRFAPAPAEATPTAGPDSPWSISPEQVESIRLSDLADPAVGGGGGGGGGGGRGEGRSRPHRGAGPGGFPDPRSASGPRTVRPVAGALP